MNSTSPDQQLAAQDQEQKRLRDNYDLSITDFLEATRGDLEDQRAAFDKCHAAGLAFFNSHESAISLDSRLNMDLNSTCYTERSETSENVLDTICLHFDTLRKWAADLEISLATLQPSPTAFANMQRRVTETYPQSAVALRDRFAKLGLPTRGFDTPESSSKRNDVTLAAVSQTNFYNACAIGEGARVEAGTINSVQNGDLHVGDKINVGGNVTGSALGTSASVKAQDMVTQIQQSGVLGAELLQAFMKAAEALAAAKIAEGDKEDVADDLAKLKNELEKPTKDEGRIKTIWDRINAVVSTVASALASATAIRAILGG